MKTILRKNTFETNSSSQHTLIITKNYNKDRYSNENDRKWYMSYSLQATEKIDNKIVFSVQDTVWNTCDLSEYPIVLTDPLSKLFYLVLYTRNGEDQTFRIKAEKIIKKYNPSIDTIVWYSLKAYEHFGEENWIDDINHQSLYEDQNLYEALHNIYDLEDFMFSPRYVLLIDWDSNELYTSLRDSGLLNDDNIELDTQKDDSEGE